MQPNAHDRRLHILVEGRVQGVGFRWWTAREARHLGLRGSVRNLADGSVEIRVAGPPVALDRFLAAVRSGPPGAAVRSLQTEELPFDPPPGFHIVG